MIKPTVVAFVQRVEADELLRKRIEALGSDENTHKLAEMTRIAAEVGFEFSSADLEVALIELGARELSAADLDSVNGGTGSTASDAKLNAIRNVRS